MPINYPSIYKEAFQILKEAYGENAQFREGQYEAIEATMTKRRTLVVQKTGWGKSLVYFICTKLLRKQGRGLTFVISPLLVLMENQMKMATQIGLTCTLLNSKFNGKEKQQIINQIKNNEFDMVFITPETLVSNIIQREFSSLRIGLFVVDEAHCISDWGHDFRLDYNEIGKIIQSTPFSTAVIATTATANNRVVEDLKRQLGDDVYVSRGPLTRESLHIQVLHLEKREERYAWLLDNLPKLPKPGIIYCLDTWDCDNLASFLTQNGIKAMSFHAKKEDNINNDAISAFEENRIDVIVATIKLGMGYDKADIAFVIHFQMPSSIVSWYQQIGRAGRKLKDAYVFLMTGEEDNKINEYFISSAFPPRELSQNVYTCVSNANGISIKELPLKINESRNKIKKALDFMENEGFVRKESDKYYSTAKSYIYPEKRYQTITKVRRSEVDEMHKLIETKECLSRFAVNLLDDTEATNCGKCYNCTSQDILPNLSISDESIAKSSKFLENNEQTEIKAKQKYYDLDSCKNVTLKFIMKPGICLSKYGKPHYGELVQKGKYPGEGKKAGYSEELVIKSAEILSKLIKENEIKCITFVPSLRSTIVKDFAERLAQRTELTFLELLKKEQAEQQKQMKNSFYQCCNAFKSFFAVERSPMPKKVLLIDDMVDSGWTLCACGTKLMEKGCQEVYPFALANSSNYEDS